MKSQNRQKAKQFFASAMSTEAAKMLILQTEVEELRCAVDRLTRDLHQRDASLLAEKRKNSQFFNQLSSVEAHNYHITGDNRRLNAELRDALARIPRPQPPPQSPPQSPPPTSPPPNPPPSPSYTPTSRSYSPQSDSQPSPSHTAVTPPYTPSDPPEDGPSSTDDDDACKEIHRPPRHIETVSLSDSGSETDEVACTPGQERRPATVPASMPPALEPAAPVTPPRRSSRTAARRLDFMAFANLPVSDYFPSSPEPANKRQRRE